MNGSSKLAAEILDSGTPVLLMGAPGTAKTAWAHQRAKTKGAHIEVLIGSGLDRTDIFGIPVVADGAVRFTPPAWARNLMDAEKQGKPCMLLLDEITCTPEAVQAPMLRLVQERRVCDWSLPESTEILLAANPSEIAAGGWDIAAPLANRIGHVDWTLCYEDWANWMMAQPDHRDGRAAVVSFLHHRPALLLQMPKDNLSGAWPSPRSWDNASRVHLSPEAVGALVGSAAAAEYVQWLRAADLPDPELLLTGKAKMPTRMDARFAAIMTAVSYAIDHHMTKEAWKLIEKEANGDSEDKKKRPDIVIPAARAMLAATKEIPDELGTLLPILKAAQ